MRLWERLSNDPLSLPLTLLLISSKELTWSGLTQNHACWGILLALLVDALCFVVRGRFNQLPHRAGSKLLQIGYFVGFFLLVVLSIFQVCMEFSQHDHGGIICFIINVQLSFIRVATLHMIHIPYCVT